MKNKIKSIKLILLLIITFAVITILPNLKVNAAVTSGFNKSDDLSVQTKTPEQIINDLGFRNGINKNRIKDDNNNYFGTTYFKEGKGTTGNAYKINLVDGKNGKVLADVEWINCYEIDSLINDGEYVLEKVTFIKNSDAITVKYWSASSIFKADKTRVSGPGPIYRGSLDEGYHYKRYFAKAGDGTEPIYNDEGNIIYQETSSTGASNARLAYLLSEKEETYESWDEYKKSSKKQHALWINEIGVDKVRQASPGQWPENANEGYFPKKDGNVVFGMDLYDKADRFGKYKSSAKKPTLKAIGSNGAINITYYGDYIKLGPFKATYNSEFESVKSSSITYNDNQTLNYGDFSFITKGGTSTSKLTNEFYIKIPNNIISSKNINKINKLNITFSDTNVYALWYMIIQDESSDYDKDIQDMIVVDQAGRYNNSINTSVNINKSLIPPIQIILNKKNTQGNSVSNAEFKVEYSNGLATETKTVKDGKITFSQRKPTNSNTFTATITETKAASDSDNNYKLLDKPIKLTFTYSNGKWNVQKTDGPSVEKVTVSANTSGGISKITLDVENKRLPKIDLRLRKKDDNGKEIVGAKFQVVYMQDGKELSTLVATSNEEWGIDFNPDVQPKTDSDVTAIITELEAPTGYKLLEKPIEIKFKYTIRNDGNATWVVASENTDVIEITQQTQYESNTDVLIVANVYNKSMIEKLTLLKADSQNINTKVQGAKFKIKFNNVESIKGYSNFKDGGSMEVSTNANGQIVLEDIVIADATKDVTITMEELEAPVGYKRIVGKITLTLHRVGNEYTVSKTETDETVREDEFIPGKVNVQNHEIALNIKDIPVMNLGGIVWVDRQQGEKEVTEPNGKIDSNEERMAGIKVELYKDKGDKGDEKITKDEYGRDLTLKTAEDGASIKYDLNNGGEETLALEKGEYVFPNIEKGTNYYVKFTYDGINYETIPVSKNLYENNNESKVEEIDRQAFNEKFKTISDGKTQDNANNSYSSANGIESDLVYQNNGANESGKYTSTLITKDGQGNVITEYAMTAQSDNYLRKPEDTSNSDMNDWLDTWNEDGTINKNHYALDINCGLAEKIFDLALGTDVFSARLTINDKSTTYGYNQILDGANLDDLLNKAPDEDIEYSLYLYRSDYNFRIDDYVREEKIDNQMNSGDSEEIAGLNINDQLRAFVTYKVVLYSQTTHSSKVDEIAYYFDNNYTDIKVGRQVDEYGIATNGEGIKVSEPVSEIGKQKVLISNFGEELTKDNNYRQELYLTFEVKRTDGHLPEQIENGLECANLAEITSYTTTSGGLIDNDSTPGNMIIDGNPRHEDDSSEAPGINISIRDNARITTGTVFNDYDKDGKINTENGIDDVIVQLIEIREQNGKYFEYIWQETRSGSNTVKTTERNGYPGVSYVYKKADDQHPAGTSVKTENNLEIYVDELNDNGEYRFEEFIPGNYIIRYIYGDGRVDNLFQDEVGRANIIKYNGQDYKSTIDNKYKNDWYNDSEYSEDDSVARDNEARRLEVMAYSSYVNGGLGTALESFVKNTNFDDLTDIEKQNLKEYYKKEIDEDFEGELTNEELEDIKENVGSRTWMAAETSRINVPIDAESNSTISDSTNVSFEYILNTINFSNMNFGLVLRPELKLEVEKHITALKVTPNGTGELPIVEAKAAIDEILSNSDIEVEGNQKGLSTIKSTRTERGFWKVETDIGSNANGATLEAEYTYVLKNLSNEEDYLSEDMVNEYRNNISKDVNNNGKDDYVDYLEGASSSVKTSMKNGNYSYSEENNAIGTYLGQYYYNGETAGTEPIVSRVENLEEALNNDLKYSEGSYFKQVPVNAENAEKPYYDESGNLIKKQIENIVTTKEPSAFLKANTMDYGKRLNVTSFISSISDGVEGISIPSYIAEITAYSNAAGRRDVQSEPDNLNFVHSEDTRMNLNSYLLPTNGLLDTIYNPKLVLYIIVTPNMLLENGDMESEVRKQHPTIEEEKVVEIAEKLNEQDKSAWNEGETLRVDITDNSVEDLSGYKQLNEPDEFWAETIIISRPTGEDRLTPVQITIITISSITVIGVAIILIKKFVLKK